MIQEQKPDFFSSNRFFVFYALVFCLVMVALWLLINLHNLQEFLSTYEKREAERENIELLRQKVRNLENRQKSLAANGVEAEKQVRETYFMHRPGEKVIHLQPESASTRPAGTSSATTTPVTAAEPLEITPTPHARPTQKPLKKSTARK